ncbi:MAG: hypothetical protein M1832_004880 [Thelocarpon impressellum]|nr:MAG: hypothetical protein M1832_004880 [Thelocarpon impressellum]
MSILPVITFKAGICDLDTSTSPPRVKARSTPGYIYLYAADDELIHFCWRPRSVPLDSPELDLVMIPGDGQFQPYDGDQNRSSDRSKAPTNGRIYALKFSSSSQRYLFWMQSKSQSTSGDPGFFGPRDLMLGVLVDKLLQGEEVDVPGAIADIRTGGGGGGDGGDEDEPMEDVEGTGGPGDHHRGGSGGAGAGATGGDIREEGEESREGGADGGRAGSGGADDASAIVQNFLNSLKGGQGAGGQQSQGHDRPFTTLPDLLPPGSTLPVVASADNATVDHLLSFLPPTLLLLAQEGDDLSSVDATPGTAQAAMEALSLDQKKEILRRVLRSPQFNQSLGSLTVALRDGGLPSVSEALGIKVEHGGFMRGGGVPLGGGDAVAAFVEGVKRTVEDEEAEGKQGEGRMETD